MTWRDVGLFRRSARTDATLRVLHDGQVPRSAFEAIYRDDADPWASADRRYRYQTRKYDGIVAALPAGRHFQAALDLGCGLGLLSARLAKLADTVLGIDLAQTALDRATRRTAALPQISYLQGDVSALDHDLDHRFDLVAIADTLYYLPHPITDAQLAAIASRVALLLTPGGVCLLADHYVFAGDAGSRLTRRIHRAFLGSPALTSLSHARHCFYLVDVLTVSPPH
jgi:predicted TPR repeat methyltransferase